MDNIIFGILFSIICGVLAVPLLIKAALKLSAWWYEQWADIADDIKTFISNRKDKGNG